VGYGRIVGRIARPSLIVTAIAPLVMAFVAERASYPVALGLAAAFAIVSLVCFAAVRR
jgi:FtsH-binding integral membrane protein